MPDTTFQTLKTAADNPTLVPKILGGMAFMAPEDAAPITLLTSPGATGGIIQTIPTDYWPVGLVTPDGYAFGGDTNTEDVDAFGYAAPVRTDIISATRTVGFTALEKWKRNLLGLCYGMDLSQVKQRLSGEIVFDHPDRPIQQFYRLLIIGQDGSGAKEWLRGKWFPRVSVTSLPEETWSGSTSDQAKIELSTYVDDVIGTGERDFIAGRGAKAAAAALGYTQDTV